MLRDRRGSGARRLGAGPVKEKPSDVRLALSLVAGMWLFSALVLVKMIRSLIRTAVTAVRATKEAT